MAIPAPLNVGPSPRIAIMARAIRPRGGGEWWERTTNGTKRNREDLKTRLEKKMVDKGRNEETGRRKEIYKERRRRRYVMRKGKEGGGGIKRE